jgi:hypothetical protein
MLGIRACMELEHGTVGAPGFEHEGAPVWFEQRGAALTVQAALVA